MKLGLIPDPFGFVPKYSEDYEGEDGEQEARTTLRPVDKSVRMNYGDPEVFELLFFGALGCRPCRFIYSIMNLIDLLIVFNMKST